MQPLKTTVDNDPRFRARFDRYHLLYRETDWNTVTHFQTGEMCVREPGNWDRALNRHYKERHTVIASTGDVGFGAQLTELEITLHDPDTKEEVKAAWLNTDTKGGSCTQRLLIDLDHNMAVLLQVPDRDPNSVPTHIRMAGGVYYPSPRAAPEGGTVQITRPHIKTDEEKEHIKQLVTTSTAWWEMSGWAEKVQKNHGALSSNQFYELVGTKHGHNSFSRLDSMSLTYAEIENKSFNDLTGMDRYRLAQHPVWFPRDRKIVNSLLVRHHIPKP